MVSRYSFVALFVVLASGFDDAVWSPTDGVQALDAVEKALAKVVALPHMTAEQSKKAKHVADDVHKAIAAVESKSNLTKAERNAKVGAAVQELADLENDFNNVNKQEVAGKQAALKAKLSKLEEQLADKKKELAKDEAAIKLATLQKLLAQKKLELQKLIQKKAQAEASKKSDAADAAQEGILVQKLMKVAGNLAKVGKNDELPAPLKAVLAEVQAFSKKESDAINQMDAANKKTVAELDAQLNKAIPTKGKDDALSKGQSLLRRLKKEEHRQYMKNRVEKKALLTELKDVEQSIKQHDAKRLQSTLVYMQHQSKAFAAKSGDFLH